MKPKFEIQRDTRDGVEVLFLVGSIDEETDLSPLLRTNTPELRLDLAGVRRINSFGVRTWLDVIHQIPETKPMYFERCSPAIIDQCNLVRGFAGHGQILSFLAPLICQDCMFQKLALFESQTCRELGSRIPTTQCDKCSDEMTLDDLEELFLSFLSPQQPGT